MHCCRLLSGEEPLMKVRLTKLADGDILAITLSHVITGQWRAGCMFTIVCLLLLLLLLNEHSSWKQIAGQKPCHSVYMLS